ncbi:PPIase cyclophilin-type domain-containing protein [Heracleum sosnowskyi]|uniref:peptidylprolyl isomerase n=1 Tax=Heracleum sosnowskyi TaxID=360622 RepID=A0AAD8HP66_9APIA|nr:PPIase cyclophilin-type domain-containing protein [Heracleum sosnowskyi]
MSKNNSFVFLDVSIDGDPIERMVFELYYDLAPKTAENFRALCTGEKGLSSKIGKPLHYKGTFFHRIIKGSMAQAGDLLRRGGKCGESIYGDKFPDERPKLLHDEPGLLSMAIADRDTHGSLFCITFKANHQLNRKYIVFGKLVEGHDVLEKIENCGDDPDVIVKIINCGEKEDDNQNLVKRKLSKLRNGKDASSESNSREMRRKRKHKKSSKDRRKKRRSSSSDDKRKKRKRSKRDRSKHGKKRDRKRDKKRKRRNKRSKHKSKRALGGSSGSESGTDDDTGTVRKHDKKHNNPAGFTGEREDLSLHHKNVVSPDMLEREDGEFPRENGQRKSNGIEMETKSEKSSERQPDVVDDHPGKSRSRSISPRRKLSRSTSISPITSLRKSPDVSPKRSMSESPSVSGSPQQTSRGNRRFSRSPIRSGRSPARSVSRSPLSPKMGRSISPRSERARPRRGSSQSPASSPRQRSASPSPPRTSSRKPESRSPVRSRKSLSTSPVRSSRRSISRGSGRAPPRRSTSRSPTRVHTRNNRRSYSRSPVGHGRRARSPYADRGRSISRSPSPDGSTKRIRRGRGFSQRYSNARRYHSSDRSPIRPYRYGRSERDRYQNYRRSPRRNRTPPRERTPSRYRSRRSRTRSRSASRSPIRYRNRHHSRSRSPVETTRYRASPRGERRVSPRSMSRSVSRSSPSESPKRAGKEKSLSSSESPPAKKGLVSYGDGSPDSGHSIRNVCGHWQAQKKVKFFEESSLLAINFARLW